MTPEQQAEVDRLVAEKLAAVHGRERMRLMVVLASVGLAVAVALGAVGAVALRELRGLQEQLKAQASGLEDARREYQRQLAADRKLQAERAAAAQVVGYQPGQSEVAYNADLLKGFISFMGKSGELRERMKHLDSEDPKSLDRFADDLEQVMQQGLGSLGQIVLRNTEPEKPAQPPAKPPVRQAPAAAPAPAPVPAPAAPAEPPQPAAR